MTQRYIAFLRAINVGGHTVKMDHLRRLFESMPLAAVETYIASGNVIFESASRPEALERKIESLLERDLGYQVATFVRTAAELIEIASGQPFSPAALKTAQALNVAFLKAPLTATQQTRLEQFGTEIDVFRAHDRQVFWLCRKKQSESKFNNAVFERALKVNATFRGINTVRKLAEKYGKA